MSGLRVFMAGYFASMATGALILGETRSALSAAVFSAFLIALGLVKQ